MDMPDPINQNTTPTPTNLANPQDLVDAALGSEMANETVTAAPEPITPAVEPLAPLTPLAPPEPVLPPVPETIANNIQMGDDTPLAFASPAPSMTPPTTTEPIQQSSYLPPVPPAPTMAPEQPKKKSKVGVVVAGILLMVMAVGGGVWGYSNYLNVPQVAKLVEDAGNGKIIKQNQQEEKTGKGTVEDRDNPGKVIRVNDIGIDTSLSLDAIKKRDDEITAKNSDLKLGDPCLSATAENTFIGACNGGSGVCRNGVCSLKCANGYTANSNGDCIPNTDVSCGRNIDTGAPVCCTKSKAECPVSDRVCEPPGRLECKTKGADGVDKWCLIEANSPDCGGAKSPTEKTVDNPTTPTMSCTGLTSVPALTPTAPVIGTKLTFTCAGAVVPASAGTLSYKFRYSINSGALTALTNKTATTAEMTIAACGTYSVECQACATLNGVLKCDPTWTGATQ